MKKGIPVICVLLCLCLLAACTGAPTTKATTGTGTSAATTADPNKKTVIVFTHWGSVYEQKSIDIASRAFEKENPNVLVSNYCLPGGDYVAKVATMLAGNLQLDAAYLFPADLYSYGAQGRLENVYDLVEADPEMSMDDFIDGVLYETEPGKVSYGWFIASEPRALFYNKASFDKANLPYPSSDPKNPMKWEAFVEICQKLTIDKNGKNALDPAFDYKSTVQYGYGGGFDINMTYASIIAGGGRIVDENGKFAIDSEKTITVLKNLQDLIFKYRVCPEVAEAKNLPGDTSLVSGIYAMRPTGAWATQLFSTEAPGAWDIACLPVMNDMTEFIVTNDCYPISVFKTPNKMISYNFLKFIVNPAKNPEIFIAGLWTPIFKRDFLPESLQVWNVGPAHPSGFKPVFVDTLLSGKTFLPFALIVKDKTPQLTTLINTKWEKIFFQNADVRSVVVNEIKPEALKILGQQ